MKRYALVILCALSLPLGGFGQDLRETLQAAAAATGDRYLALRNQIVEKGPAAVPELERILKDERIDWHERAMAGIAIERIQKGGEIDAFVNHNWEDDPRLKDDVGWKTPIAAPLGMGQLAVEQLVHDRLANYSLEQIWKQTAEHPRLGRRWQETFQKACEELKPPFFVHLAREKVANLQISSLGVPYIEGNWYYEYLLRVRDRESLPLLFDLWLKARPIRRALAVERYRESNPHRSEEDIQRFADKSLSVDGRLRLLLAAAGTEDEQWILEKLKDVDLSEIGRRYLEEYRARCRAATQQQQP
jgi:hypothetical protein